MPIVLLCHLVWICAFSLVSHSEPVLQAVLFCEAAFRASIVAFLKSTILASVVAFCYAVGTIVLTRDSKSTLLAA